MNIFKHVWKPAIIACRNCSALHPIIISWPTNDAIRYTTFTCATKLTKLIASLVRHTEPNKKSRPNGGNKNKQEGQHPLTGQRAANFRLLANQWAERRLVMQWRHGCRAMRRSVSLCVQISKERSYSCKYIDTTRKAIDCATTLPHLTRTRHGLSNEPSTKVLRRPYLPQNGDKLPKFVVFFWIISTIQDESLLQSFII